MATNEALSRLFSRIADLMEIDGQDGFRISSYRRASRSLDDAAVDARKLAAEGKLTELPGIGKGMAQRIEQYLQTGHIDDLTELESRIPSGLPAMLEIPGLGPKKVAAVHKQLGVCNLDDLQRVIASGELSSLPGFGEASVRKIAEGMAFLERSQGRTPLGIALPIAEVFAEQVASFEGVHRVEIAGSLRRGLETIGDIDILCDAEDAAATIRQFVKSEGVLHVLAAGDTKGSVTVEIGEGRELQIDLRAVERDAFGAALQYFTGSKEHNVRLREIAVRKKWRLNEYGLHDGEKRIAGKTEAEIYMKLGFPLIPPELREDRGEIESPTDGADLVTIDDIRGDLHMHTTASDGRNSIEEMAAAAKELGYSYIAICDHSRSSTIANGLSVERMEKHIDAIRAASERMSGITILVGCECDILPDGSMDYPDEILARCDWVVASIHSAMGSGGSGKLSPTERTLAAIENRYVCTIGHPSGRLINKRAPMELDMAAICEGAARTGTCLEINASWQRLDLKDVHARQALDAGVKLVIDTDAHHVDQLMQMRFGVTTARRAGAEKKRVLNCGTLAALKRHVAAKRNK